MRNVSRFRLRAHTLAVESSIWHGENGQSDKCPCAAVQNEVHVLFHCQDLCAPSEESTLSFSSLSANPFLWRPVIFHMPCLVRLSLIFFLNGTIDSAISFRTLWTIFWLAKTSNKPISLTTWLAVDPYLVIFKPGRLALVQQVQLLAVGKLYHEACSRTS